MIGEASTRGQGVKRGQFRPCGCQIGCQRDLDGWARAATTPKNISNSRNFDWWAGSESNTRHKDFQS